MRFSIGLAGVLLCFAVLLPGQQPVPGANVNMVAGTSWPDGDPFLQRQNEPSIAVSSVNPQHLLAGANDYRTTDLELDPGKVMKDAWLGVFKSYDGGLTWRSTLLPGCPYNTPICTDPVLKPSGVAYQFSADPTVRPGTHGWLYYNGIAANRTGNDLGVVFVSRFYDYNNSEAAGGDPIKYLDTTIVDRGTSGQFQDKPWLAADSGEGPGRSVSCQVPNGGTVTSGRVYLAYSTFTGGDNNIRSKVAVAVSTNCGKSWNQPVKLSESNSYNLGTTLAVDPLSGAIYVAWRRLANGSEPDAILIARSTDFGNSWSKAIEVAQIKPFDMAMSGRQFRHRSFPTLAVSVSGSVSYIHLAWAENGVGPGGDARIVLTTSADGGNSWPAKAAVDDRFSASDPENLANRTRDGRVRGHQLMPALTFAAGKLMLVYYDFRDDNTIGTFTLDSTETRYIEKRKWMGGGTQDAPDVAPVFTPLREYPDLPGAYFAISDATDGLKRRHIVDVRAVQGIPGNPPAWGESIRVSRYAIGYRRLPGGALSPEPEQVEFNAVNLPMFKKGTYPFMGDYIDVAARLFKPGATAAAPYVFNTAPSTTEVFHTTWTDNRDVRLPKDGNWANYRPPISQSSTNLGPASVFDPAQGPREACVVGQTGIRNQNIYTARLTQRLVVGAVANTKVNLSGQKRSFVVYVQNATGENRTFSLAAGTGASFEQFRDDATSVAVTVPRLSTVSRTVFVTPSGASLPKVTVTVTETSCASNCLSGSVVLNDAAANSDLYTGGETFAPKLWSDPLVMAIAPKLASDPPLATPGIGVPSIAGGDPTVAGGDPSLSGGDPSVSGGDPTLAGGDPTLAGGDPTLAGGDPSLSGGDPTLAGGDPTLAGGDPTLAGGDATVADVTWPVNQRGNASGSFTIKPFQKSSQSVCCPQGVEPGTNGCVGCILVLHKLYPLPAVQTGSCNLVVRTTSVVASASPNPSFTTNPSGLTTLGTGDPALPLAGQGTGFLTLRTFSPGRLTKPQVDELKTNLVNALRPVTVSQSVNSVTAAGAAGCGGTANPCPQLPMTLTITASVLPSGLYGTLYTFPLTSPGAVVGGQGTLTWTSPDKPAWLGFSSCTVGTETLPCLTGAPTAAGTFAFKLSVADTSGQSDSQRMTLTVAKAAVTVTADAKSKIYGQADPALTYTITSGALAAGDSFSGDLTRAAGENVGAYAILQGTLALSPNYILTYVGANLTITKATTTTTVTSDLPDPSFVGQPVTVKFTVAPQFTGTPTGTVTVSGGGATCTGTLTNGQGNCTLTPAGLGDVTLTAAYSGDSNFFSSNSSDSNSSASHKVIYRFTGFLTPLTAAGTETQPSVTPGTLSLGQAVPVKWQLMDFAGAAVQNLASLASLKARLNTLACAAPPGTAPEVTFCVGGTCTGNTTYRYGAGGYIVNADTTGLVAACYDIILRLNDTMAYATTVRFK